MVTLLDAPRLVEDGQRHYGRFQRTPIANPFDADRGPARGFEWFRTKEWVGFTLSHHDMFCSMIIQDAKYLASSELYVYDRAAGALAQHAVNRLVHPLHLSDDITHSRCAFIASGYRLGYSFDTDMVTIVVDIDETPTAAAVHGRLDLDVAHATAPLVVSAQLPGGDLYTNKIVYPASGAIACGDRQFVFDPARDFAILDEHKSHLPYRCDWTWGTFVQPVEGGIAGANLAQRPCLPDQEEESCIWTPQGVEALSDIAFVALGEDEDAPWQVRSADGRVDVVFTPEGHKRVDTDLVVAQMHYAQWFGHYNGKLSGAGATWPVQGVPGVLEKMQARL